MDCDVSSSARITIPADNIDSTRAASCPAGNGVDTAGWIAQLQFFDDSGFDHVAVLPHEADARAQIATWCRTDYRECGPPVTRGVTISDTDDDDTVITRWTEILGGLRYRIFPVAAPPHQST